MASVSDVAKLAGVSRSTVSLVCNNKGYVSQETREKIERAMKELNYTPSELGRNLKKQRSDIIGIIVPDVAHPFFSTFIKLAEKCLYNRGYKTMVCGTAGREDVEEAYIQMLERRTMDGVIMGAHSLKVERYLKIDRPIVTLDRYLSEDIPSVRVNKVQAAEKAAELFLSRSRRNVVQIVSSHTVRNYDIEKEQTFRRIMEQHGVTVTDISAGHNAFTEDAYRRGAEKIFRECPDADGIFGTDMAILACMKEARKYGRRTPEDVSMVAIDGTYVTRIGKETVTAVVQPLEEMAQASVELIVSMVEKGGQPEISTVFDAVVQAGETC